MATPTAAAPRQQTWRITVTNLTGDVEPRFPAAPTDGHRGQPLSPPLALVHTKAVDLYTVGEAANASIEQIAEDGNPFFGQAEYQGDAGVRSSSVIVNEAYWPADTFAKQLEQPIWNGESRTFTVTSSGAANRLSLAMMLGFTNDAFTGVDSIALRPGRFLTNAYDAGTELNTELCEHVANCPPPHFAVGPAEGGVIHPHPGLVGGPDSVFPPEVWGWTDPVAQITISLVR